MRLLGKCGGCTLRAPSELLEKSTGHRIRRMELASRGTASGARAGTVRTGHAAFRNTFSATDPSMSRSNPDRPCVPITIRSTDLVLACARDDGFGNVGRFVQRRLDGQMRRGPILNHLRIKAVEQVLPLESVNTIGWSPSGPTYETP